MKKLIISSILFTSCALNSMEQEKKVTFQFTSNEIGGSLQKSKREYNIGGKQAILTQESTSNTLVENLFSVHDKTTRLVQKIKEAEQGEFDLLGNATVKSAMTVLAAENTQANKSGDLASSASMTQESDFEGETLFFVSQEIAVIENQAQEGEQALLNDERYLSGAQLMALLASEIQKDKESDYVYPMSLEVGQLDTEFEEAMETLSSEVAVENRDEALEAKEVEGKVLESTEVELEAYKLYELNENYVVELTLDAFNCIIQLYDRVTMLPINTYAIPPLYGPTNRVVFNENQSKFAMKVTNDLITALPAMWCIFEIAEPDKRSEVAYSVENADSKIVNVLESDRVIVWKDNIAFYNTAFTLAEQYIAQVKENPEEYCEKSYLVKANQTKNGNYIHLYRCLTIEETTLEEKVARFQAPSGYILNPKEVILSVYETKIAIKAESLEASLGSNIWCVYEIAAPENCTQIDGATDIRALWEKINDADYDASMASDELESGDVQNQKAQTAEQVLNSVLGIEPFITTDTCPALKEQSDEPTTNQEQKTSTGQEKNESKCIIH